MLDTPAGGIFTKKIVGKSPIREKGFTTVLNIISEFEEWLALVGQSKTEGSWIFSKLQEEGITNHFPSK